MAYLDIKPTPIRERASILFVVHELGTRISHAAAALVAKVGRLLDVREWNEMPDRTAREIA